MVEAAAAERGLAARIFLTERGGHASALARDAVDAGSCVAARVGW